MKIGIIGAGWYGAHIARMLSQQGHEAVLLEAGKTINSRLSGMFGIRRHEGPHYPRSRKTRESCHRGAEEFDKLYPELIIEHQYSIYALGAKDVDELPSKVTKEEFSAVCRESVSAREINIKQWGLNRDNVLIAFDLHEPSIAVGKKLRQEMLRYLKQDRVNLICNYPVKTVQRKGQKVIVNDEYEFDVVINATSFQSLLPEKPLLFKMDVKYQVCLALIYEDLKSTSAAISKIFLEGWFPCLMPYDDRTDGEEHLNRNYILTHGKWTIMDSVDTPEEAEALLAKINDRFVLKKVKPRCEKDMTRFWPIFPERFKYKGWVGNVIAKIRSNKEFRSAVTFADNTMTYIIPGKVTNIGDAARETIDLLNNRNIKIDPTGRYRYVSGGVLDDALQEITEQGATVRNTCDLQTYEELLSLPEIEDIDSLSLAPSPAKDVEKVVVLETKSAMSRHASIEDGLPAIGEQSPSFTKESTLPSPPKLARSVSARF